MADVVEALDKFSTYKDSQASSDRQSQLLLLKKSATLYVGNLSFYTTEEQIYELFSKCTTPEEGGGIKRIIMGLDRNTRHALSTRGCTSDLLFPSLEPLVASALWNTIVTTKRWRV